MGRHILAMACSVALLLGGSAIRSEDSEAPSWAEVRASMRKAAKEVGAGARELGGATGKEARLVARGLDESTHEPRREAADDSKGLWAELWQGLTDAVDDLAGALRELREDAD